MPRSFDTDSNGVITFDEFVETEAHPRPVHGLDRRGQDWAPGSGFDTLGWAPDGKVYGTYRVTITEDGGDFLIEAWTRGGRIDDDEVAYYHRTRDGELHSEYLDWPLTQ